MEEIYMINVKDVVKPLGSQGFLIGIGVAALAYFLTPQLKQSLRPAAVKGAQGMMALGSKTKHILEEGKEKISSMLSDTVEGTSDKIKEAAEESGISHKMIKELHEERAASNKMIKELKDSIAGLKEEIAHIKKGQDLQET
jgi:hypothetical protein